MTDSPAPSSRTRLRVARWSALTAAFVFALVVGGSAYEHLVVDTVWLNNLRLIQIEKGGIDRTFFWLPMHGAVTLTLLVAIVAAWRVRTARNRLLIGAGLYVVMRAWTFAYFVPFVLQLEALDAETLSPAMHDAGQRWIGLSMLRLPLVAGALVACWSAYQRLLESEPRSASTPTSGRSGD